MSDQPENTPAGSYRVAGNDVSHYLGVDNEYMNYADETQKPMLNDEEAWLYLPAPVDEKAVEVDEEAVEDGDEDEDEDEHRPTPLPGDFVEPSRSQTPAAETVTLAPKRPAL